MNDASVTVYLQGICEEARDYSIMQANDELVDYRTSNKWPINRDNTFSAIL